MDAAIDGPHHIVCAACGLPARVPEVWMDFCASCAQSVFRDGRCRICRIGVEIKETPGDPNGDRQFIHPGGWPCKEQDEGRVV